MSRQFVLALFFVLMAAGCSSPLTSGLSNTIEEARIQFDERVRAEFPIGSSEGDMVRTLQWQGFERHERDFGGERGRVPYMSRSGMSLACGKDYRVYWEAEDDRLTDVRGVYSVSCF